ncbi:glucose dehydrogenase [FAD, quinone]-like [Uloborus diversus]|uniref:glucose dehydrogenase [FAD, quinone]-like n=1 Tax=Uloborus diversus TaxID=327109 RepID=UPI002409632C|nr:glucose dehydrogenase [FAD, quinone]-like [Uloborus diversus]
MPNTGIAHLQSFVEGDNFVEYLMRADFFFEANKITSDDEKRALLLTAIGKKTFSLLRNLLQPKEIKDVKYADIVKVLTDYYSPASSTIMERFRFYNLKQGNEDISTFIVKIKELASKCNFGAFLNDALRDKLVCGLQSEQIQNKLLSEKDVDFAKASELALAMETASRETKSLKEENQSVLKIHEYKKVKPKDSTRKNFGKPTYPHQITKVIKSCKHCAKFHRGEYSIQVLGHKKDFTGVHPLDEKCNDIYQASVPTNCTELKRTKMNYPPQRMSTTVNNSTLLPLLPISLARQKHSPKVATTIRTEYDYVFVGAGSARSVVANRLSEVSCQTIYPRGKTLGDSSVLNAMIYIRGNRHLYDDLAAHEATGWSYKDVLHYFKKMENNRNADVASSGTKMNYSPQRVYSTPVSNSTLLPLLLLSLARQKHSPKVATKIRTEYDYVIVGGGAAGSVVANRLSEVSCVNVLLLEAGPSPPILSEVPAFTQDTSFTKYDWNYVTTPQKNTGRGLIGRQLIYPRGKTLGGTTISSGMIYSRGNPHNYDDWAAEGAKGWSYKDVLPYFKKFEDNRNADVVSNGYHAVGGPVTVQRPRYRGEIKIPLIKSAIEMGYDFTDPNGKMQTGFNDHQAFIRDGQRCSTAKAYLVPAENRTNLDILTRAMVRKVLIKNKQAVGVIFDHSGDTYEVRAKREVILSAGTINTPQILMLSGIGPKKELEKFKIKVEANLPVGLNLQDHVGPSQDFVLPSSIQNFERKLRDPKYIYQYIYNRTGPLASSDGIILTASLNPDTDSEEDFPDHELLFAERTSDSVRKYFGLKPEVYRQVYGPYENKPLLACYAFLLQPKSRGRVTLNSENPYDPPLIDPNYFDDPRDLDSVVEALKSCNRIGNGKYLRKIGLKPISTVFPGCEKYASDDDLYFRCQARTSVITLYHPVGTAKMGNPGDRSTVVDPFLRVKHIKGLRVVDASIMPIIPSGSVQAPTIMIGEKASDIIKSTIKCEEYEDKEPQYDDYYAANEEEK